MEDFKYGAEEERLHFLYVLHNLSFMEECGGPHSLSDERCAHLGRCESLQKAPLCCTKEYAHELALCTAKMRDNAYVQDQVKKFLSRNVGEKVLLVDGNFHEVTLNPSSIDGVLEAIMRRRNFLLALARLKADEQVERYVQQNSYKVGFTD